MRGLLFLALAACSYDPSVVTGADPDASPVDTPMGDTPPLGDPVRILEVVDNQVTGGPHAEFPLLVKLTRDFLRDRGNGGDVVNADGFDIYFSADRAGTARLAHEVERYDAQTGALIAWVKVPALDAATAIYLHYGSDEITTSQEDVAGVWSSGYVAVLHLDEAVDSSKHATNLTVDTSGSTDTPIDRGQHFDGNDDRIRVDSPTIDNIFATTGTAQGWFFATGYGENGFGRIWDKGHTNGWSFGLDVTRSSMAFVHGDSTGSFGEWNGPTTSVTLNAWHLGVVVYDKRNSANTPLVYVDGVAQQLSVVVAAGGAMDDDGGNQLMIGNRGNTDRTFQGDLDEVRMSNVARSPEWIATEYVNQVDPDAFYTLSEPL